MEISIFSCFIAVLCSSLMILMMYLFRKKWFLPNLYGVSALLCLYFLCFIRMLLPMEFPFTYVLDVKGIVSNILYPVLWKEQEFFQISWVSFLIIVLSMISGILLLRFIWRYQKAMKEIQSYEIQENESYRKILEQVMSGKKKIKVVLRSSEQINIPIGIGIFNKNIILPMQDYNETELYYILLHEYTHFLNKDIFSKLLIHIFCCIFWWNPIVYLLKKDLDQMLEIKCDLSCTASMRNSERIAYLSTIVTTVKKSQEKSKGVTLYPNTALFQGDSKLTLVERFQVVSSNIDQSTKKKHLTAGWIMLSVLLFLASYSILPQTAYDVTREKVEDQPGAIEVLPNNSYIRKNNDGTYDLITEQGESYRIEQDHVSRMEVQGFSVVEVNP